MKTVTKKQTITKKYLEFESFEDFERNIDIQQLRQKNSDYIDNVYDEFLELTVEDNIEHTFGVLMQDWGIEYSDFNYSVNPLYARDDKFYITEDTLRRAVDDDDDELHLTPNIGFWFVHRGGGVCTQNTNIDDVIMNNGHVDADLFSRLEDFLLEFEKGLKEWIKFFYEDFDFHDIILAEIWFRIELEEIKITEGHEIEWI